MNISFHKNYLMRYLLLGILCCSLLGLEACGFRLKGSNMIAVKLPPVFLVGDASSALMNDLRRAMVRSGTIIATDRKQAELILTVRREDRGRRALSIGSSGKVKEYELQYSVQFNVTDAQGMPRMMDQSITLFRAYEFDETSVLSKDTEEKSLYKEMQRSAVDSILRRLQALSRQSISEPVDETETTVIPEAVTSEPVTSEAAMPETVAPEPE